MSPIIFLITFFYIFFGVTTSWLLMATGKLKVMFIFLWPCFWLAVFVDALCSAVNKLFKKLFK